MFGGLFANIKGQTAQIHHPLYELMHSQEYAPQGAWLSGAARPIAPRMHAAAH